MGTTAAEIKAREERIERDLKTDGKNFVNSGDV